MFKFHNYALILHMFMFSHSDPVIDPLEYQFKNINGKTKESHSIHLLISCSNVTKFLFLAFICQL